MSLVAAMVLAVGGSPSATWAATVSDEVHYTFTGSNSVAIDWRGQANDVRWGTTTDYGNSATGVAPAWMPWSSPGPFWQLEIGGLSAGSTYHYSIGGGPDYTFHAPPTTNYRFDAIGDIGDTAHFGKLGTTLDNISADDPSFVLMVGDLTYANSGSSGQSAVDTHFNDVMRWSVRAAYMPAWGNHEYDVPGSDDLRNYKGRLLLPNAAASPGSPAISCCGDDWGWFDSGPVRFISYPEPWTGAWTDWQSKAGPVMRQAQDDPNIKYIVTYGHRPAYSTGYHAGETQIASILGGFGAAYSKYVLNINGHSHDYERFEPIQGVTHVTVGAPSSLEQPWTSTDARTANRAMHLSHLRVDVGDTGIKLQAICDQSTPGEDLTCSAGSVIDEFVIGTPPALPVASDFYVDKTSSACSDSGLGSKEAPFCTVTKGVARLQPGNALYIGDGSYAETIKPSVSGTASAPVTITSWPGRSPVIGNGVTNGAYISNKSYITLSNLTFTATTGDGVYVTKSDHITVAGNTVTNTGRQVQGATAPGISIRATNNSVVSNNDTTHNSDTGIYVTNTSTGNTISSNESSYNAQGWQRNATGINVTSPGNTITRNVTHDNEDTGVQLYTGANNNLVTLNVTYNNGDHGIDNLNVTGGTIVGNTVFHNCTSGINLEGATSGSYRIANNIAVDNAVYPAYSGIACARRAGNIGVWDGAQNSTLVDHNLVYLSKSGVMYAWGTTYSTLTAMKSASGQEAAGIQADPVFLDKPSWNLQLKEGSPAIDRADSGVPGEQTTDILSYPRVRDPNVSNAFAAGPRLYDDLGAYELQPDIVPVPIQPPVAGLTLTPSQGTAPLAVTADASASVDPQGQVLSYAFDFGDGATVTPQAQPTVSHTYLNSGVYTVRVTARNTSGVTGTASGTVTVNAPPPPVLPPTAVLTVTPTDGVAPLPVTADASASTDPQGAALTYAFDFGDGTVLPAQTSPTATHVYQSQGTFSATVTVASASGLTGIAGTTVTATTAPNVQPPAASLSMNPTGGTAPLPVTADASASSDPQGQSLTYAFDFGDGTTAPAQPSPTATHTYTAAGSYLVTLTVRNVSGLSDTAATTIAVSDPPPIQAPVARLTMNPTSGTTPLPVTADASASSDPQGQSLTYAFDFGDGTTVPAQASPTATHTYSTTGTFTATLTVTNSSGRTATAQQTVTTTAPIQAPVARLSMNPTSGTTPLPVTADASASSDPQGQSLTYAFDFGDGTTVPAQPSPTATHTYSTTGTFTATLTVTNNSGRTATAQQTVTTTAPIQAPVARLTMNPTSGTTPLPVTADASASSDPQGQSLTYAFDFGDGTTVPAQPSPTATHTYSTTGTFTATLTVTNSSGRTATAQQTVTTTAPIQAPVARLTMNPTSGTTPLPVTADASASSDPQGQSLTYAFDFGDGTTVPAQPSPTATHTYSTTGTFTATLTVTNSSGRTATAQQTVTTSAQPAYVATLGTSSATTTKSSGTVTVSPIAGVRQGDLVVITLQIAAKSTSGAVAATDSAGNVYAVARDVPVSGGRLLVLTGLATKPLASGAKITATFPGSSTYQMVADELGGVTRVDRAAAAVGTSTNYSSGLTATTTAPREVVFGAVATFTTTNPTWTTSWTALTALSVPKASLGRAYQLPTSLGTYKADGTIAGTWAALVITFKP